MNQKLYTVTVYSENHVGLLSQIANIFTRRFINIESLTVSASAINGVHKFTIICISDIKLLEKVVKQIEKKIDVLKAYCCTEDEVILREIALFKISTGTLLANNTIEGLVNKFNAKILEVNDHYTVIEKTGNQAEIQELYKTLEPTGILQFVRSGSVSITRSKYEQLSDFVASGVEL
ncbi:MAG: acetolactate synthase small subunit [Prevotellaceae bacterium]|jgi:acetolactate synthase-1/3 small subunit|nr:acetolactate synthase small subunit [Prevotellaceae bacterium]